jgi:Tol biopolymer transport system component
MLRAVAVTIIGAVVLGPAVIDRYGVGASTFDEWSAAENVGAAVNSAFSDFAPQISSDGLSLYFASNRPDGQGGEDLWVSQRASRHDLWGPPSNVGVSINTTFNERSPALSQNGHLLFFATDRPGGSGGLDMWITWRADKRDDFGWEPPVNLGTGINSAATDAGPSFLEHSGRTHHDRWSLRRIPQLYMASSRPGGAGGLDIYVGSVPGGWFGPPVLVSTLSTPQADLTPNVRRDGLEIFLASDRPGTIGGQDLWIAWRKSSHRAWSTPENLGPLVNSTSSENFPSLSADARTLYFTSSRAGGFGASDLYVTTRGRGRESEEDDE